MISEREDILIGQAENLLIETNEARDEFEEMLAAAQEAYRNLQECLNEKDRIWKQARETGIEIESTLDDLLDEIENANTNIDLRYAFSY